MNSKIFTNPRSCIKSVVPVIPYIWNNVSSEIIQKIMEHVEFSVESVISDHIWDAIRLKLE